MTEGARAQDQGRRHRRKGTPATATASLLTRYQDAMRTELGSLLDEIAGEPMPPGLLDEGKVPPVKRPAVAERARLWDLAIKIGRELGTEVDSRPPEDQGAAPAAPRPRRRRVDFGPDR